MKKVRIQKKILILFSLLVSYFFLFNFISCGIDTYYVIEAPQHNIHSSQNYQNTDKTENYFEFWTNESGEYPSDFKFMGTEVYYKIYADSSSLTNEVSNLNGLASSTTTSASAPTKLTNTTSSGGYGYKRLGATNYTSSPLIKASASKENQRVYIRLTDYLDMEEYSAKITVNGEYISSNGEKTVPVRDTSEKYTFNFGRKGTKDKILLADDEDVKYSSSNNGKWYVALYAVAIGRDITLTNNYSNILYLGSQTIDAESEDN